MTLLDELKPGKRENAFYVKNNALQGCGYLEDRSKMPKQLYVYEWDEEKRKRVGHLVDAIQYYSQYDNK